MNQLTHEKARGHLQRAMDKMETPMDQAALDFHLASCAECKGYGEEINQLRRILSLAAQNAQTQRKPLNIALIKDRAQKVAARRNIIGVVAKFSTATISVIFITWLIVQNTIPNLRPTPATLNVSPAYQLTLTSTPNPTLIQTATDIATQECRTILYTIKPEDTLGKISEQFNVEANIILADNHMSANDPLIPGHNLIIPDCLTGAQIQTTKTTPTLTTTSTMSPSPQGN